MPISNSRRIEVLGVPMDLGSHLRGVDMGPSAIRIAGLLPRLRGLGLRLHDRGNLAVPHAVDAGKAGGKLKYESAVRRACMQLAREVETILRGGGLPLVLGGDHSLAIGTLAGLARGARRGRRNLGLLWVDAHGDCNTPATSPSGNIHGMPLAVALGLGPPSLRDLAPQPMAAPEHTVLFGVRNLDAGEKRNLKSLGATVVTMRQIDELGVYAAMQLALRKVCGGTDGFHLSFDIDSLDPRFAPGVGTPVQGGLTVREAHLLMELVADTGKLASCELVEVNPVLDERNATAALAVDLLYSAFGGTIL
ncbi:MAG: arginase [Planctomycetota bacterium]|nr:arginase [Planctomycetota bacterium]